MDMVHTISNASDVMSIDNADTKKRGTNTRSLPARTISRIGSDEVGIFEVEPTATTAQQGSSDNPAEILPYVEPEARAIDDEDDDDDQSNNDGEDDESDFEYDDEDEYAGFLGNTSSLITTTTGAYTTENDKGTGTDSSSPARIRDEDDQPPELPVVDIARSSAAGHTAIVNPTGNKGQVSSKWRQPSKAAVSMSLRVEQEKTGGKRRLAQDLYRIMNQDTQEAGFSLYPAEEDSMDKWMINLFQFDEDSNLAKDMMVLGVDNIELEMSFPDQYPFEPPFVRVVKPRFKRQTGFVMNGALCMELLTKDGWNPINDIESVIVSVRSLLPVGNGRLEAAVNLPESKYNALLKAAQETKTNISSTSSPFATTDEDEADDDLPAKKRIRTSSDTDSPVALAKREALEQQRRRHLQDDGGVYTVSEAQAAYSHLSDYHKKKGWDTSGWWASKG